VCVETLEGATFEDSIPPCLNFFGWLASASTASDAERTLRLYCFSIPSDQQIDLKQYLPIRRVLFEDIGYSGGRDPVTAH
jgi:hypothetical protein